MQVLLVEDDVALVGLLKSNLTLNGHEVCCVSDGISAVQHVLEHSPEMMILDLGLPMRDGLEVLSLLNGHLQGTSVMVLTARISLNDRIRALELGADDCMTKPFSLREFQARCEAIVRRRGASAEVLLRHGDVTLNRMQRKVNRAGSAVALTVKEFALLEYLMLQRGRCVSREELLREVWSMPPTGGTNVVDVYVNYIRRKLGAYSTIEPKELSIIETVWGAGYCLRRPESIVQSNPELAVGA
jgi:DNA-binding response OmpR family regulator